MTVDEKLKNAADEVRVCAANTPPPESGAYTSGATRLVLRLTAVAVLIVVGMGALALLNDGNGSENTATGDQVLDQMLDRFTIDGMHLEDAAGEAEGPTSEVLLNTPNPEPGSSLPGVMILTGDAIFEDLSTWARTEQTATVLGRTVNVYSRGGDPLAVEWRTASRVPVMLIGEGYELNEFEQMLSDLRQLSVSEWTAITRSVQSRGPEDIPLLPYFEELPVPGTAP